MIERALLHTDGGSRGNPGPSGIGFALLVDDSRELITLSEGGAFIGEATNNVAEYHALLWGLKNAAALDVKHVDIRADSELLVKQIKGEYKVKNEGIKPLYREAQELLSSFAAFTITHVYREDNARADMLANEAMDTGESVGTYEVACTVFLEGANNSATPETTPLAHQMPETLQNAEEAPSSGTLQLSFLDSKESDMTQSTTSSSGAGIYSLTVKNHFDAAHALVGYPGECRNLHGHTWDIEATVSGTQLDDVGIVYDFKALKTNLTTILDDYDHHYLNEVPPFDTINATAENLARVIYERLEALLPAHITLDEIAVWESPIAKLTYRKA